MTEDVKIGIVSVPTEAGPIEVSVTAQRDQVTIRGTLLGQSQTVALDIDTATALARLLYHAVLMAPFGNGPDDPGGGH